LLAPYVLELLTIKETGDINGLIILGMSTDLAA